MNEMADALAKTFLNGHVIQVLPASTFIIGARLRRKLLLDELSAPSLTNTLEFQHLNHYWNSKKCQTRAIEVAITRLRCQTPYLNFYLHRAGLAASPNCSFCGVHETTEHYLIHCNRYSTLRKLTLGTVFRLLRLDLSAPNVLSFGALSLGYSDGKIADALQEFLKGSQRFRL